MSLRCRAGQLNFSLQLTRPGVFSGSAPQRFVRRSLPRGICAVVTTERSLGGNTDG
jgi:hypothetical protein